MVLVSIYVGCFLGGGSVYVCLNLGVGNFDFGGEDVYVYFDFVDFGFCFFGFVWFWDVVE